MSLLNFSPIVVLAASKELPASKETLVSVILQCSNHTHERSPGISVRVRIKDTLGGGLVDLEELPVRRKEFD